MKKETKKDSKKKITTYTVDTSLLHNGQVFKNYKELARLLGWKSYPTTSSSTLSQRKALSAACHWTPDTDENGKKLSNRIIIHEVYPEPKPIVDKRKLQSQNYKIHSNFNVPYELIYETGVYRVVVGNKVYVGSTSSGFRKRFNQHRNESTRYDNPRLDQLYEEGGVFEIVEVMTGASKHDIIQREMEYINQYLADDEWNCINQRTTYTPCSIPRSPYTLLRVNRDQVEDLIALAIEHGIDIARWREDKTKGDETNE